MKKEDNSHIQERVGDSQGREKGTDRLSRKANPRATPIFLPWAPDKASP